MMSGHGPNPIFFNDKKMKAARPEHLPPPTPTPPSWITSHFCLNPSPLPRSKWKSYAYQP